MHVCLPIKKLKASLLFLEKKLWTCEEEIYFYENLSGYLFEHFCYKDYIKSGKENMSLTNNTVCLFHTFYLLIFLSGMFIEWNCNCNAYLNLKLFSILNCPLSNKFSFFYRRCVKYVGNPNGGKSFFQLPFLRIFSSSEKLKMRVMSQNWVNSSP